MGQTRRRDNWWVQPLAVFLALSTFIVYAMWAGMQGEHYYFGPYLSPFYAPELYGVSPHAWFGPPPSWWPSSLIKYSPTFLIIVFPLGFRFTCYYYRGAYYKAFWADPPNCAVGEPRKSYWGENSFPLIIQNIHRYFLYAAVVFVFLLAYDVWKAMWFLDPRTGQEHFGIGVGTLVLATNVVLISAYTFGCHSMRHLAGGFMDRLSESKVRKVAYDCSSCLNRRHQRFAWMSLFAVGFADVYVRLCSMGIFTDYRIL